MPPPARTMPAPFPAEGQHTDAAYPALRALKDGFSPAPRTVAGGAKRLREEAPPAAFSLTYFAATDLMTLTSRPL